MNTHFVKLSGLNCPACKKLVEKRISKITGVRKVDVTVQTGSVVIDSEKEITHTKIKEVLKNTSYKIVE